jgi:hypothetical protein
VCVDVLLTYDHEDMVDIGYVGDLHALLEAMKVMPETAVLCLEGTTVAPDIAAYVQARQPPDPPGIDPDTIWPTPSFFHLPLQGGNLQGLCELAAQHAGPEVADHFVVYDGTWVLLWAHDAGCDQVRISRRLPKPTVARLKAELGEALRRNT